MNRTWISSEENHPGGDYDTFLMAFWIHIPLIVEEGHFHPFQVISIPSDSYGSFYIELAFDMPNHATFPNVATFYFPTGLRDRFGATIVNGGTAGLNEFPPHYYRPSGWNSIALSAQMSTHTLQWLVNGILYDPGVEWHSNHPFHIPATDGFAIDGGRFAPGYALSNYYLDFGGPFVDLTIPTNVDRLFSRSNLPVSWGPNGELVNGRRPWIFLSGNAGTFLDNLGLGGPWNEGPPTSMPIEDYRGMPGPGCTELPLIMRLILFDDSGHLLTSDNLGRSWSQFHPPTGTEYHPWNNMTMAINDGDYTTLAGLDNNWRPSGVGSYAPYGGITISTNTEYPSTPMIYVGAEADSGIAITTDGETVMTTNTNTDPCQISRNFGATWTYCAPDLPTNDGTVPGFFPQEIKLNGISYQGPVTNFICPTIKAGMPSPLQRLTLSFWMCSGPVELRVYDEVTHTTFSLDFHIAGGNIGPTDTNHASVVAFAWNYDGSIFYGGPGQIIWGGPGFAYSISGDVQRYYQTTSDGLTDWIATNFVHFLLEIDLIAAVLVVYANGQRLTTTNGQGFLHPQAFIGTETNPWEIRCVQSGTGGMSDFWISDQAIDITNPSVRSQFINPDYTAVPLPEDGHIMVGGAPVYPVIFLHALKTGQPSDFLGNSGTGPSWAMSSGTAEFAPLENINCFRAIQHPYDVSWLSPVFSQNADIAYVQRYNGKVYKSSNNLAAWNQLPNSAVAYDGRLRCSSDGQIVGFIVQSSSSQSAGVISLSRNGGDDWTLLDIPKMIDPTAYVSGNRYVDFAMTPDGMTMLWAGYIRKNIDYFPYAGVSYDNGHTWEFHVLPVAPPPGLPETPSSFFCIPSVTFQGSSMLPQPMVCNISPDGKVMLVGSVIPGSSGATGNSHVSSDSGKTWKEVIFPTDSSQRFVGNWVDAWVVPV